ncbi:MAG: DUF1015 domain-containing protein [Acidobacteria bacterium]|nr:DUF1015 domain-containing protein [Acidobacteriota bacterium]
MATVRAFRALRPDPDVAPRVAAVPYDVVGTDEARALAVDPLSFLHVSRAEIDLPPLTDPHADIVYRAAAERYQTLKRDAPFVQEEAASLYMYRLEAGGRSQTGLAACYSLDEYDADVIKKHERTRRDKEDDRTRHMVELRAQTGPVFLTHRPSTAIDELSRRVRSTDPLFDFVAVDKVRHTVWLVERDEAQALEQAFASVKALYIADGHHRAASAARARQMLSGSADAAYVLGVAFPSDHVRILPYNRVVRDLNGRTPQAFLGEVARHFTIRRGEAAPSGKGEVSMYVAGAWHLVDLESAGSPGTGVIDSLDCNVLQERLLMPLLGIKDVRTDPRVDFIGGSRGTTTLEQVVDSGNAEVAFSMYPVGIDELMAVSDAGAIMPPKSTWFEPKLRDGLLIHEI